MLGTGLLYLFGLLSLASWVALGAVVASYSPDLLSARFLFLTLLFIGAFFSSTLLAHYASLRLSGPTWQAGQLRLAVLCGVPPAVAIVVAAWLQSLRVLGLVSGLILVVAALLVEFAMVLSWRKTDGARRVQEASS